MYLGNTMELTRVGIAQVHPVTVCQHIKKITRVINEQMKDTYKSYNIIKIIVVKYVTK